MKIDWVWLVHDPKSVIESNVSRIVRNIVSVSIPSKGVIVTYLSDSGPLDFVPFVMVQSPTEAVNAAFNVTEGFNIFNFN